MKKFGTFSLIIILIVSGILIGNPLTNNTSWIIYISLMISGIYILIKTIKDKEYKLIENKIDVAMIILTISSYIPLIFKKYATLEGSIEYILRYTTILAIYFLVKEVARENIKFKKYIANTIIIIGIIILILGIDNLSFNIFGKVLDYIGIANVVDNNDNRIISTFGYANSFCVAMAISYLISIFALLKNENLILKNIYLVCMFLFEIGIVLSYSRAMWIVVFLITILMWFILEKSEKKEYLRTIVLSYILAIIYAGIFKEELVKKEYIILCIMIPIFSLILILLKNILDKIQISETIIKNIKKYKYIFLGTIVASILTTIFVGLNLSKQLEIFQDIDSVQEYSTRIYNIGGNKEYKLVFDIEAKQNVDLYKNYKIIIEQKNNLYDTISKVEEEIGNFSGKKEFKILTKEDTTDLKITFKSSKNTAQRGFVVKSLTINDKEEILKYAYLPKNIVEKVQNIRFTDVSVIERIEFINTGIKIGINNLFTGVGGDGFKYLQGNYQSYYYYIAEPHSYIVELFCEFGIVGTISFIFIIVLIIKEIIFKLKNNEKKDMDVYILLLILVLHCIIDFDISFMYLMIILYALIGIISSKKKEINIRYVNRLINIIFVCVLIINVYANYNYSYNKTEEEEIYNQNLDEILIELEAEPYKKEIVCIEKMITKITENINNQNFYQYKKYIDEIYIRLEKSKENNVYNVKYHLQRLETMKKIDRILAKYSEEQYQRFQILEKDTKEYMQKIIEDPKSRLDIEEKEEYEEILNDI